MRVLITGMGGQLGTLAAQSLERLDDVETVAGYDLDPPRRRLRRAVFRWISPPDVEGIAEFVAEVDPTVVLHLGIYEPHARLSPPAAHAATTKGTTALTEALVRAESLESIVVRSGIELYGRRRGAPMVPDEHTPPDPTTAFGRAQLAVEQAVVAVAQTRGANATLLRCAPVVGSHTPSPLGRLLRLGIVPVPALAEPTFSMLHAEDAADAMVAAVRRGANGAVNVVAPGATSALQAARLGGRVPLPLLGPGWRGAAVASELLGAPLPDHLREQFTRGRAADGSRCGDALGMMPTRQVRDILVEIHEFAPVEYLPVAHEHAA